MIVDNQKAVVAMLSDPASYGSANARIEKIDTHISRIFLVGGKAYKLKRAVKLPYVDFSTPDRRLAACEKEVELNGTTAPEIYLGVKRILRSKEGRLCFGGEGILADAVVEMKRFDQSRLLDRIAASGMLTPALMADVARVIERFHRDAPETRDTGGAANMAAVLDINEAGFGTSHVFERRELNVFNRSFRQALARHSDLLDRRAAAGKIRRCHGDLHLRNICLLDEGPRLFDCIEFNDAITTVDVLYDLAFLLMDLWHGRFPGLANLVANRYLDDADDEDGFVLLPFFMAVRAAVRAHVTATQIEENGGDRTRLRKEARSYFDLAKGLLGDCLQHLIAIGGLSGTGKTTVAEALAAHVGSPPGARIVESDRIRKAMHGVAAETHLPDSAYRPEISERVYAEMAWRGDRILSEGGSVVADAVYDRQEDRERIDKVAKRRRATFTGIWLEADPSVLRQRVRRRKGSASDATIDILSNQLKRQLGKMEWAHITAERKPNEIVSEILKINNRPVS